MTSVVVSQQNTLHSYFTNKCFLSLPDNHVHVKIAFVFRTKHLEERGFEWEFSWSILEILQSMYHIKNHSSWTEHSLMKFLHFIFHVGKIKFLIKAVQLIWFRKWKQWSSTEVPLGSKETVIRKAIPQAAYIQQHFGDIGIVPIFGIPASSLVELVVNV